MESQPSTHTSLRPTMSTRPSGGVAPTATVYSPNFLTFDQLMLNQAFLPQSFITGPCLYSTQISCTCAFGPHHTCSLHQPPIAYGQASSSFLPAVSSQQTQQVGSNTSTSQSTEQSVQTTEPTSAIQRIEQPSIELARNQTRLPATLANPMRSRMKRAAPSLPPQVQSALEARTPKIRRVASDSVQTVRPETVSQQSAASVQTVQQPEAVQAAPPSTSQLVTGTVPSSHQLCTICTTTQRCASCAPHCLCAMCPQAAVTAAAARAVVQPTSASVPIAVQASRVLQPVQPTPRPQQMMQLQQQVEQQHQQLRLLQQQQHHQQQQLIQQGYFRNYIQPSHTVLFPLNRAIGLDTLLVNVAHPEYLLDRTVDRHHMFAAPVADPQPVGLSVQDIEKHSEKLQFVKDCELPEEEQERCTVCQCELETGEEVRHLSCSHQFHVDCIDRWLGYNKKCPVCRLDIDQPKAVFIE